MTHKIDGKVVSEFMDHDTTRRALKGLLAIQLHAGPAMKVEIKDIRLKDLPDGGVITLQQQPIPPTAKLVEPRKRKSRAKARKK